MRLRPGTGLILTLVLLAGAAVFVATTSYGPSRFRRLPERLSPQPAVPEVPASVGPAGEGPLVVQPTYSPDGRQIAFASNRSGGLQIWIVGVDGRNLRQLTTDRNPDPALETAAMEPAWSPDGSRIAFVSDAAGNDDIWLVRPDGSDLVQVTKDPATDDQPAWSPDGRQIAFVSDRSGTRDIWVMNADGSGARRLTSLPEQENAPSFSPDGSQIVFRHSVPSQRGGADFYLMIINANGTSLRQLTAAGFRDSSPSWGPRGILFQSDRPGSSSIWMVQPDGSGLQAIGRVNGSTPRWSPDGMKFVFNWGDTINEFVVGDSATRRIIEITGFAIAIDIKPGDVPNSINLRSKGKIPVAILSGPGFQPVQDIDQTTITFGHTGDERSLAFCAADEISGDGVPDLVCHFETELTGFRVGDSEGILRAVDIGRIRLEGRDSVRIVP